MYHVIGVSDASLHRESTDSLKLYMYMYNTFLFSQLDDHEQPPEDQDSQQRQEVFTYMSRHM